MPWGSCLSSRRSQEQAQQPITEADFLTYVQTTYGANAAKALAAFDVGSYATSQLACATACQQFGINQALSDFQSLAYHTSDIQYVFPL